MFTAEELAGMRATQEDALPETASIYSVPLSSDGQGGYTEDALSLLSTAACRVAPAGGSPSRKRRPSRISGIGHKNAGASAPSADTLLMPIIAVATSGMTQAKTAP